MLASKVKVEQKHLYYHIVMHDFDRGELSLEAIGLFDNQVHAHQDPKSSSLLKDQKVQIALFFKKLLLTGLDDSICKFQRNEVEHYLRSYLETVISVSYFKVPEFREKFLESLSPSMLNQEDLFEELNMIGLANDNNVSSSMEDQN